ncbi:MAG: hypothetical protein QMB94_01350 [Phycisphaerales bacterium]
MQVFQAPRGCQGVLVAVDYVGRGLVVVRFDPNDPDRSSSTESQFEVIRDRRGRRSGVGRRSRDCLATESRGVL